MSDRDWEAELRKIDRRLEHVSDEAVFPAKGAKSPAAKLDALESQRTTSTFGVFARLTLAVLLGAAIVFWPYGARCGLGMTAYLGAVFTLVTAGVWSSVWTWRHRAARAHLLALLLVLWGLTLGAVDLLPRLGYAKPTAEHPAVWSCSSAIPIP
jgi:hypothetical protein